MTVTASFIISFSLSIFIVAAAVACGLIFKKKVINSGKSERKRSFVNPFNIFLLGFFFAATVMAFPVFYFFRFTEEAGVIRFLKSVLISVLNTLQMFFLNADFLDIKDALADSDLLSQPAATAYTTYFSMLYVVAPFLTFGFILSFFKDFSATLKYALRLPSDVYYLSELNERSLALAEDIINGNGKKLVVFTDVYGDDEEKNSELIAKARKLGALCFKNDITEIRLKRAAKKYKRKFYFIGEDEDENLRQALELIDHCKSLPKYDNYNTQFFVFANSTQSEVFLDSIDNGNMKVRRVTDYWNTILKMLEDNSVFKTAVEKDGKKEINLVIVGIGGYGTELLKIVCWLGQMPGYIVNIHAFDKDDAEDKFKIIAPELLEKKGKKIEGEPYYNIEFYKIKDVNSSDFYDKLAKIKDVSLAYVALGNDEMNIETSVKMRRLFARANLKTGSNNPPIYTIIFNSVKSGMFTEYGLKSLPNKENKSENYNIIFYDGIGTRYKLDVIEREKLENDGLDCHLKWSETIKDKEEAKKNYERYEYHRKSSIAESIHTKAMKNLGLYAVNENGKVTEEVAICEHNRWSAYMRAEGHVYNEEKNDIAKTHNDLKPFNDIGGEQQKDYNVKS